MSQRMPEDGMVADVWRPAGLRAGTWPLLIAAEQARRWLRNRLPAPSPHSNVAKAVAALPWHRDPAPAPHHPCALPLECAHATPLHSQSCQLPSRPSQPCPASSSSNVNPSRPRSPVALGWRAASPGVQLLHDGPRLCQAGAARGLKCCRLRMRSATNMPVRPALPHVTTWRRGHALPATCHGVDGVPFQALSSFAFQSRTTLC